MSITRNLLLLLYELLFFLKLSNKELFYFHNYINIIPQMMLTELILNPEIFFL